MRLSTCIVKSADNTVVIGLISNNDESKYRQEVDLIEDWCRENNLSINVKKTRDEGGNIHPSLDIGGVAVEVVSRFKHLWVHISNELTWSNNSLIKKAHQRLYFLRKLKHAGIGISILTSFYRCMVEIVLTSCITVWWGYCSVADRRALQRIVKSAQKIHQAQFAICKWYLHHQMLKKATCIMTEGPCPPRKLSIFHSSFRKGVAQH